MTGLTLDAKLMDQVSDFYADPLGYVMFAFPWGDNESIDMVQLQQPYRSRFNCEYGPDKWACEFLDDLGQQIKDRKFNGRDAVDPIRFSTASGHGIGKSTLVAWLILFILDTRPWSMGVVTANTSDQLRTKTWSELSKWHQLAITSHFWNYNSGKGSMFIERRGSKAVKQKWRCDAQTCREENAESFQGLHAANSTPFFIFDEASGIPETIWEARFGAATDGEPMSFDFGNPTRKSGYFFENTIGQYKHRFNTRSIDSRDVQITNKDLFKEWAADWGEDSDLFKVKVRGVFPSAGSVQFISGDRVKEAMERPLPEYNAKTDPLVIGVDVARFGDNATVIYPRFGNDARSFGYRTYHGLAVDQVVEKVIDTLREFRQLGRECKGLFIDGGGTGSGVVDLLRRLGYNPIDVNFGGKASDMKYQRRGDQMWGEMRDSLLHLCLPHHDKDLVTQLTQREYGYTHTTNRIKLETKDEMSKRGAVSPDIADALSLTYASEPAYEYDLDLQNNLGRCMHDYDPLDVRE